MTSFSQQLAQLQQELRTATNELHKLQDVHYYAQTTKEKAAAKKAVNAQKIVIANLEADIDQVKKEWWSKVAN